MNKKTSMSPQRKRERALFLYASALQNGDFDTVSAVLKLAEGDAILDRMLKDLDSLEAAPEVRAETPSRPLQNGKGIQQNVIIRHTSPDGRPSKLDLSQEDTDMNLYTTFEPSVPVNPKTLYPFAARFITLTAAILIVALVGGILIQMVNKPLDGYPGSALQTTEPACIADTVSDPAAEAERLGNAADDVLDKQRREGAELATLLAICGLQTGYVAEADAVLQRSLDILGGVPTFPDHDFGYNTSVFSPDGQWVLVGSYYETTLWDIATQTKIHTFPYHRDGSFRSNPVAFSPDGKWIVTFHQMGAARIWDAATGETIRDLDLTEASNDGDLTLTSMVFSPDGEHLLLGLIHGNVQVWDVNAGTMERAFQAGSGIVASLMYAPDGRHALINIQDETAARLWDTETEQVIRDFSDLVPIMNSVALSADGRFALTSGEEGTAILYNAETGDPISTLGGFDADINVVAFSPDGQYALVGNASPTAQLYDLETGAVIRRFVRNDNWIGSASFSPDGSTILLGSINNGSVRLWPTTVEDTIALACSKLTRDFTDDERAQYGLGEGKVCP